MVQMYVGAKGTYIRQKLLGRGGMAITYKGLDQENQRDVVIKEIRKELKDNSDIRRRFVREIREQKRLKHTNIVEVLDDSLESEDPFAIIEYCKKGSLKKLVDRGSVDVPTVVKYVAEVLEGLVFIHKKKLVHRDISPENILVNGNNVAKISDFGLCLPLTRETPKLTKPGETGGKQIYMAPEQWWKFDEVTARADIYSLGVSLYYILSNGRIPHFMIYEPKAYPIDKLHVYALAVDTSATLPISTLNMKVPWLFDDVVSEMTEKEENKRDVTAAQVREALESLLHLPKGVKKAFRSLSEEELSFLAGRFAGFSGRKKYKGLRRSKEAMAAAQEDRDVAKKLFTRAGGGFAAIDSAEDFGYSREEVEELKKYLRGLRDRSLVYIIEREFPKGEIIPTYAYKVRLTEKGWQLCNWLWWT